MPKYPCKKGDVPSTARRASPKLPINERVKRSYPQNSIPNVNPFRLKQMNFRIKIFQGCRGPDLSHHQDHLISSGPFDFCFSHHQDHLISVWPERSGRPTKTLKRNSCARLLGNRMHIIIFGLRAFKQMIRHLCHVHWSFPKDCLSQSATKTTLQKSSV